MKHNLTLIISLQMDFELDKLYVTISIVTSKKALKILISNENGHILSSISILFSDFEHFYYNNFMFSFVIVDY